MPINDDKQLFQVQNIIDTLLEATNHFANLLKEKEFNQSITIFSSIVEGSKAVMEMLNEIDETFIKQSQTLEKYLVMIVEELEKGNLLKIAEIVQFSLHPHFVQLQRMFIEQLGNHKKREQISIGIFHSWVNPKDVMEQERLDATLNETEKQDVLLYFFTSNDVNFDNRTIHADTFQNNAWERVTIPFPDVINNNSTGKRSHVDRKLRRDIPFTNFYVGNKYTLPKEMIKQRKYTDLLVPFQICSNEEGIFNFLNNNNNVVFKALGSNRGENIYFVTKRGSRYAVLDQKKERIMNEEVFRNFIKTTILEESDSYIIQKYIHTRTKDDEPYHFRSHVQKDGEGKWQVTHIYPRIGNKKSNLSNISTEGRVEVFSDFLVKEHGKKHGAIYEQKILNLSIDIAQHLDKIYGLSISELGLDFAIDDTGRIWMHEANNGPQTAYHEDKRAINFIAYAKYIAKNGIMYTDNNTKNALIKGQFHAKSSNLPVAEVTELAIGVLVANNVQDNSLNDALVKVAQKNETPIYFFTPKDIDFDLGLIKGLSYENNTWTEKIFEYPNVIIDHMNLRAHEDFQYIYDELADIPLTNEWPTYKSDRIKLFKSIKEGNDDNNLLSPYQPVKQIYNVLQFIKKHKKVNIIPNKFSSQRMTLPVEKKDDNTYLLGKKVMNHSELTLRHALQHELKKEGHILMKDVSITLSNEREGTIKLHLMKCVDNEWKIVSKHGEILITHEDNSVENTRIEVDELLQSTFNDSVTTELINNINNLSLQAASTFEKANTNPTSELLLEVGIDENEQIRILDANPSGPRYIHQYDDYAEAVISYAISLVGNTTQ